MKALILSGGTGTRLRPITYTTAKQLLPLANKPILVYLIEKIVRAGIKDIGIIVGDMREQVKQTLGNGDIWGVSITYIYQEGSLGLAHAVATASEFIGGSEFLMILGDNIFNMELDDLIKNFYTKNANSTILLHRVKDPCQYGVAMVRDGEITGLCEKPREFISDLILTGVYIFDSSIFSAIEKIKPSSRGELEITDAIQNQVTTGGRLTYELLQGWWKDTGKLHDLLEANRLMLDHVVSQGFVRTGSHNADHGEQSSIIGEVLIGDNVVIKSSRIIGPVHIDDDAVILNSIIGPYASLGKRCRISDCEIEDCIILHNAQISNIPKRISRSLFGKNVSVQGSKSEQEQEQEPEYLERPERSTFFLGDDAIIEL